MWSVCGGAGEGGEWSVCVRKGQCVWRNMGGGGGDERGRCMCGVRGGDV